MVFVGKFPDFFCQDVCPTACDSWQMNHIENNRSNFSGHVVSWIYFGFLQFW